MKNRSPDRMAACILCPGFCDAQAVFCLTEKQIGRSGEFQLPAQQFPITVSSAFGAFVITSAPFSLIIMTSSMRMPYFPGM